jgi:hypothetical protein
MRKKQLGLEGGGHAPQKAGGGSRLSPSLLNRKTKKRLEPFLTAGLF